MALIDINHLTKHYGDVHAVEDLTFAVDSGTITGFLGPNGSGKTTTLRSLLGLVTPTAGSATIDGSPYAALAAPLQSSGRCLRPPLTPRAAPAAICACSPPKPVSLPPASTSSYGSSSSTVQPTGVPAGSRSACASDSVSRAR